ncbi:MAG: hypothetical protein ACKO2L_11655 [Planctomycetaceae bacterium]
MPAAVVYGEKVIAEHESYSTLHQYRKSTRKLAISDAQYTSSSHLTAVLPASTFVKFGPFCTILATSLSLTVNS